MCSASALRQQQPAARLSPRIPHKDCITVSMDLRTSRRQSDASTGASDQVSTSSCSPDLTPPADVSPACSGSSSHQAKKCVNRQSQRCTVCGDRAYYVFYGAVACDSCRTFFRRQVLHSKDLSCHFSSTCQIRQNTRKDCASCRLDKCLAVGMKRSLVAVGEAESARSSICFQSSPSQPLLPAAAAEKGVLLCRSKSVSEIPAVLPTNPIHVSGTRASVVMMTQGSGGGRATGASFAVPPSQREVRSHSFKHNSSPIPQFPDYDCRQVPVRRCHSLIPRSIYLTVSDAFTENSGAMHGMPQRNELSSIGSQGPASDAIVQPIASFGQEAGRASHLPILMARLSLPQKLQTEVASQKPFDESSETVQELDKVDSSGDQKSVQPWGISDDSSGSDPGRFDGDSIETKPIATRKLIHPRRRLPPVSQSITLGRGPVIHVLDLSSTEKQRFREIMDVTQCLDEGMGSSFKKLTEDVHHREKETSFIPTMILVCAKMLLSIAEKLAVFSLIPRQDKEVLLKGSLTEILFLRSAKFFSPSHSCWIFGSGHSECVIPDVVPIRVLQVASQDVYERYSKFVSTFDPELYDGVICNLMCVICFLTERSDPLIQKNHIRSERSLYLRLLNRYLEAKYAAGAKLTPAEAFANIEAKLNELTSIKEIYEQSDVDLDNIDQLVLNYQQMRLGSPPLASESLCHGDGDALVTASHTVTSPS